jgi:phosphohistidine phosphatase
MQRLILLRHGEAEAHSANGRDLDRALTANGVAAVSRAAKALAAVKTVPDLALVSAARRTRETWQVAKASFPLSNAVFKPEIYNAGIPALLAMAQESDAETVMIVGHNPAIQGLALDLLARQGADQALVTRVDARFPPATAAVFSFQGDRPELDTLLMAGLI